MHIFLKNPHLLPPTIQELAELREHSGEQLDPKYGRYFLIRAGICREHFELTGFVYHIN